MWRKYCFFGILMGMCTNLLAQQIQRGATEDSVSRSEYFTWLNNTNEGSSEQQTVVNLDFFQWLHDEYGMKLDIYAFDSGVIDGKNFYGTMDADRFRGNFPHGFENIYQKAIRNGTRLGLWGGPDGFGNGKETAERRKQMLVNLCRDYRWALFKFDAVCGSLRMEKEADFADLMSRCRKWSPDLILLNHRLGLKTVEQYATTFLWEGRESYIDVNFCNTTTAVHHRAGAMSRGSVPGLQRLTEDHGVCLSSCLDYWEDELILHAFNRSLILSPQIYGNPWLLNDAEYPKLARIFNLHKKYAQVLVHGMALPSSYGLAAVARGNDSIRFVTLRNLSWTPQKIVVKLNEEIGLKTKCDIQCKLYHPVEKWLGTYKHGQEVEVTVLPFRSLLFCAYADRCEKEEIVITGVDYEVVKDIPETSITVKLLGFPSTKTLVGIIGNKYVSKVMIDGEDVSKKVLGGKVKVCFPGRKWTTDYHRKLADLQLVTIPQDVHSLYEATAFAADNNALEVRSLQRSGKTAVPQVQAARDAFFNQSAFVNRGVWDKNLFDGNMNTFFAVSKIKGDVKIRNGCFRLDLGHIMQVDSIRVRVLNEYLLQPLLKAEGCFASISSDLKEWKKLVFLADTAMTLHINRGMRYLKMNSFPEAISEVEVYSGGVKIEPLGFRASNLMSDGDVMKCTNAWKGTFRLEELAKNSYLCVAVNGSHGVEAAYAALKVDGQYIGASSRSVSYPVNPWENKVVAADANYTYYFPLDESFANKNIEAYVLGYRADKQKIKPEVWITAYPIPYEEKTMVIYRNAKK